MPVKVGPGEFIMVSGSGSPSIDDEMCSQGRTACRLAHALTLNALRI